MRSRPEKTPRELTEGIRVGKSGVVWPRSVDRLSPMPVRNTLPLRGVNELQRSVIVGEFRKRLQGEIEKLCRGQMPELQPIPDRRTSCKRCTHVQPLFRFRHSL